MANNVTRWPAVNDPPNLLLAVDPGASWPKSRVPYAGCALFQWGELSWAALVRCPVHVPPYARYNALVRQICLEAKIARHSSIDPPGIHPSRSPSRRERPGYAKIGDTLNVLVVEQPIIYVRGKSRPQDIVSLSKVYGAMMSGIDAEFYSGPTEQEWKGGVEKEAYNELAVSVANAAERLVLVRAQRDGAGGLSNHVLDAFGIGLFCLGRVDRGGVL